MLDEATEAMEAQRSELRAVEDRMKYLSTLMEYSKTYRELKPIYMAYHKAKDKNKESLHRQHESDILLFESMKKRILNARFCVILFKIRAVTFTESSNRLILMLPSDRKGKRYVYAFILNGTSHD